MCATTTMNGMSFNMNYVIVYKHIQPEKYGKTKKKQAGISLSSNEWMLAPSSTTNQPTNHQTKKNKKIWKM